MTAEYPAAVKTFDPNVDNATDVNAAYADQRDEEIAAIQNALGTYPYGGAFGTIMGLPGLRAFWPFSSVDSDGNAFDVSGQGHTLNFNAVSPSYDLFNNLALYADFSGVSDYLEGDTGAVTGNALVTNIAGVTFGFWAWLDDLTGDRMFMSEGDGATASGSNWNIYHSGGGVTKFTVFKDTDGYEVSGPALNTGQWYHIVAKWEPGTRISVTVNGVKSSNITDIPSSLNYNALNTQIGAQAGNNQLDGRIAMPFICACALPDALITALFWQTRERFGV